MTSLTYEQSDILFTIFNLCFWLNDIVFEATTTAVPIEADLTTTAGSTDDDDVTISTTNDTNTVTQATTEQASTDTTTTSQTDIETVRPTTSATATLTDEEYEDDTFYGTDLPDVTSTLSREFEFEAFLWGKYIFSLTDVLEPDTAAKAQFRCLMKTFRVFKDGPGSFGLKGRLLNMHFNYKIACHRERRRVGRP